MGQIYQAVFSLQSVNSSFAIKMIIQNQEMPRSIIAGNQTLSFNIHLETCHLQTYHIRHITETSEKVFRFCDKYSLRNLGESLLAGFTQRRYSMSVG